MELKPSTKSYKLVVEISKDLDFEIDHLDKQKAEILHGEFIKKFGKDNVYAFCCQGYIHMEETVASL